MFKNMVFVLLLLLLSLHVSAATNNDGAIVNVLSPSNGGVLESYSSQYSGSYPASALTNGNVDEAGWSSTRNPSEQGFIYTFKSGKSASLNSAQIHGGTAEGAYYSKDVEVWVSADGNNFSKVASGTLASNNDTLNIDLNNQEAKSVKLVVTSGYRSDYWELAEFIVNGTLSDGSGGNSGGTGEGTITRQVWTGISGTGLSALTSLSSYPNSPTTTNELTSFEAPSNWAGDYGTRIVGYLHAPVTGDYTFWIATDDNGELWLSTNDSANNRQKIAWINSWAGVRDWTKFASQKSVSIRLEAGQRYYIEALQKEAGGGDNIAVAWQRPGGSLEVIPGEYLSPFNGTTPQPPTGLAGYTKCTDEGGSCTFTQRVDVAYGANGQFVYRAGVTGTVTFNNGTFGDPIPGIRKAGYWKAAAVYLLTVNNGNGDNQYVSGAQITITADAAPSGKVFDRWVVNSGNPNIANLTAATTTLTMPARAATVTATYKNSISLRNADNPANTVNGLDYKYYSGTWNSIPNFSALTPVKVGALSNYNISGRLANDNFGFAFDGYVNVPADGTYTFYTRSDDGSKLYIGDTIVVDNDGLHGSQERSGQIGLKAGKHAITVDFFEKTGGEVLDVRYQGPGVSKQLIPNGALFRVNQVAQNYSLSVASGSGDGRYVLGEEVTIVADATPSGMSFDRWVVNSGSPSIDNVNTPTTILTMPARAVSVTAEYKSNGASGPAGYIKCADEGGACTFTQRVDVAYGANGQFVYRAGVTGTVTFNNGTFGDPISGVRKAGYWKAAAVDSDTTRPVITLLGDQTISVVQGATFNDPGAVASDDRDGDITSKISRSGSVNTNTVGTYTLSYNVRDEAGNNAPTVQRIVNVTNAGNNSPKITLDKSEYAFDESIRISYQDSTDDTDWVGIYKAGTIENSCSTSGDYLTWQQAEGASGTLVFTGLEEGAYDAQLFAENGYCHLGSAVSFRVTADGSGGGTQQTGTFEKRIASSLDDVEERSDGSVNATSSDLELVFDSSNQIIGMRFTNVSLPKESTVTRAYVQFTTDETNSGTTSLSIKAHNVDDAPEFSTSSGNVSSRATTNASVNWQPGAWSSVGAASANERTPDIKAVIQEVVSRSGWNSGNDIALIVSGAGERTAESYDGSSGSAPLLHIEYSYIGEPGGNPGGGTGNGEGTKIAFIGDTGAGGNFQDVLNLIKSEGAELTIVAGDTSYSSSRDDDWDAMVRNTLGSSDPALVVAGNHDYGDSNFGDVRSYGQSRLNQQSQVQCSGSYAEQMTCNYKGIYFVMSAIGSGGSQSSHESFISNSLNNAPDNAWRICAWHKNQKDMQVGGKSDETGWTAYETCRQKGAIISTGHEHSYSRTHLLSDMRNQSVSNTSSTLTVSEGETFAFVSGLGGVGVRDQERGGDWWAKIYTSTQGARYGAMFGTFYEDRAEFYFKNINGEIIDQFTVIKGY